MTAKRKASASAQRRPLLEWIAAGLGLALTLSVVGYCLWEGLTAERGHPILSVVVKEITPAGDLYVVKIRVRNAGFSAAAAVEVTGTIEGAGAVVEEHSTTFAYVPGQGSAEGGLVFHTDPRAGSLVLRAQGYADP